VRTIPNARRNHPKIAPFALPVSAIIAGACHLWIPNTEMISKQAHYYPTLLVGIFGIGIVGLLLQAMSAPLRRLVLDKGPILAAGTLLLCGWEMITLKFALLPMPYFPGPILIAYQLRVAASRSASGCADFRKSSTSFSFPGLASSCAQMATLLMVISSSA